jgi:hypothetical protein
MKCRFNRPIAVSAIVTVFALARAEPAQACGGFFCSQQGVNQAAERIVFADNGDGTITAVIQISYQGPGEKFSWLLPISSVPAGEQIAVSSDAAFALLQAATNPQYSLQTRLKGKCREDDRKSPGFAVPPVAADVALDQGSTVSLDASGEVGSFQYSVISVDAGVADPAAPALDWLQQNGYDVPPQSAALLRPYLADGMHLLALRLSKGADAGSIRPIELTYAADAAMIPIKLTAVAANQNMGVLTWALSSARAIPFNYNSLELNETRVNWFNAAGNYDQVVTEAADAAGGQGFVTEFAGPSTQLANVVWSPQMEQNWQGFQTPSSDLGVPPGFWFQELQASYGTWSGFWDAARSALVLPADVSFDDFKNCSGCYVRRSDISYAANQLLERLDADVIEPVRRFQRLIDRSPYTTRLYTTLSAAEMLVDPVFRVNADLPDVSNLHSATRVIECRRDLYESEAPWHIEFADGNVLRGAASSAGSWPDLPADQPANQRVLMLSTSGEGRVLEDNSEAIASGLSSYNASVPVPEERGGFCSLRTGPRGSGAPGGLVLAGLASASWWRRRRPARRPGPAR